MEIQILLRDILNHLSPANVRLSGKWRVVENSDGKYLQVECVKTIYKTRWDKFLGIPYYCEEVPIEKRFWVTEHNIDIRIYHDEQMCSKQEDE